MSKRRITVTISAGLLALIVVIILLIIPFRGWTRASLLPAYTKLLYGTRVSMLYDNEFPPINKQLKIYGFDFVDKLALPYTPNDGLYTYTPLNGCRVEGYQGIHETITCHKVDEYKPQSFSQGFIDNWAKHSPEFVHYLESRGWHKEYPDQPSYVDLFKVNPDNGNWLTYIKNHEKVHCVLTIAYNPPYPNPDDQVWIHEECNREVQFFQGY